MPPPIFKEPWLLSCHQSNGSRPLCTSMACSFSKTIKKHMSYLWQALSLLEGSGVTLMLKSVPSLQKTSINLGTLSVQADWKLPTQRLRSSKIWGALPAKQNFVPFFGYSTCSAALFQTLATLPHHSTRNSARMAQHNFMHFGYPRRMQ